MHIEKSKFEIFFFGFLFTGPIYNFIWPRVGRFVIFCIFTQLNMYVTENNFGLIHVYFLYTVFRATYRAVISKVTWLVYTSLFYISIYLSSYLEVVCSMVPDDVGYGVEEDGLLPGRLKVRQKPFWATSHLKKIFLLCYTVNYPEKNRFLL